LSPRGLIFLLSVSLSAAFFAAILTIKGVVSPVGGGIGVAIITVFATMLYVLQIANRSSDKHRRAILRVIFLYIASILLGWARAKVHGWTIGDTIGSIVAITIMLLYIVYYCQLMKKSKVSAKNE
jgi:hypothetical protein